jgi:hypothetical protein
VACNWGDGGTEVTIDGDAGVVAANTHAMPRDGVLQLAPDTVVVLRSTE